MSLNKSIINIRVKLQNRKLKKSGKNSFAGFNYFELSDFLPTLNELMKEESVNDKFSIEERPVYANGEMVSTTKYVVLELVKEVEVNTYKLPYYEFSTPLNKSGNPSMQDIQYLGALITYYKRYIYMNAFGITDGEVIDAMDKIEKPEKEPVRKLVEDLQENHKREIWTKFKEDIEHEEIDMDKFLKFYNIKMTQKVKLMKFVEEYTSDSELRNQLVLDYKNKLG